MPAHVALLAGLFALAVTAVPAAGQPKAAPKFNPQKLAAAQQALLRAGCQFGVEKNRKSEWVGHVRTVNFPEKTTDVDFTKAVPHLLAFPALTGVDLGGTKVTDAGAKELAKLPDLEALFLDDLAVTGETVKVVGGLGRLQWLVLHTTRSQLPRPATAPKLLALTAADMAELGKLTALEHLEVGFPDAARDADLAPLAGLKSLRELQLYGGGGLTGGALAHLATPDLTKITLGKMAVGDAGARILGGGFPKLTALDLSGAARRTEAGDARTPGTGVTDEGVKALTAIPALRQLNLSGNAVTLDGVDGLDGWVALKGLALADTKVGDVGVRALAPLRALDTLDLSGTAVTDAALPTLGQLATLTSLELGRTKVTGQGFAGVTLPKLSRLGLPGAPVSADGLKAVAAAAPALAVLNLDGSPVDDAGLRTLARVRTIRTVYAVETKATAAGKSAVERAVPGSVVYLRYPTATGGAAGPAGRPLREPTTRPPTSPGRP